MEEQKAANEGAGTQGPPAPPFLAVCSISCEPSSPQQMMDAQRDCGSAIPRSLAYGKDINGLWRC